MVDLSGVYIVKAKGRTYHYAWRGKGAPRLISEPGSAAYVQELADALASRKTGDRTRLSGLCARYRADDAWTDLAPKTRRDWSPWLDRIQEHFGNLRLEQFDRPAMRPVIDAWRKRFKKTPRAADMGLQVMSRLLAFGVDEGRLSTNIVAGMERLYRNDRSHVIWTEDDLAELEKVAAPEIMHAARLAVFTGLRQGDLLRLSWSHVRDNAIEVRTAKTGKTALIPLHGQLRAFLDALPRRATTILTTTEGRPWRTGFGASWGRAVRKAGIDKHFHDLRGTAATVFYLAGLTVREIAEVMAWSEDHVEALINRYVKRDEILLDLIRRLDENRAGTEAAKPSAKPSAR